MMKTAASSSPHSLGATSPRSERSESPSQPRSGPRTVLDVFNAPVDLTTISPNPAASTSPRTVSQQKPATTAAEVSCSPSRGPASFSSSAAQPQGQQADATASPKYGSSPSLVFRGLPGSPVLNVRKSSRSASIGQELEDFHLGESATANKAEGGILHHNHHHYHHAHRSSGSYSPRISARRQWSLNEPSQDEYYAAAATEELRKPAQSLDAGKTASGTPSPRSGAPVRRASIQELIVPVPLEQTTVSSTIPLYQIPPEVLVPFVDRPKDMKKMLSHSSCSRNLQLLKNVLGEQVFEGRLMKLWTETDRNEVSDAEWLMETRSIIMDGTAGSAARNNKLWGDFCDMVGFDEEKDTEEGMEKIGEEEE